jgi:ABC-type transport system involved in multi-copper enzyme maturation permease subunit
MVRAELTKLRTLRSTFWTVLLAFAISAGLAYPIGRGFRGIEDRDFDPLFATFYSLTLGQLALVVFGVMAVAGEYSSGSIRSSLAAMPQRGRFATAKFTAIGGLALAVSVATVLATFFAAQAGLGPQRAGWDTQAVLGAVLYLVLICLFAGGMAMMLRSAAICLAILMPLLFLGSQGLGNIPKVKTVTQYLPDQAGMVMHLTGPAGDPMFGRDYGPWTGLGITALWTAAALFGGFFRLNRRDC